MTKKALGTRVLLITGLLLLAAALFAFWPVAIDLSDLETAGAAHEVEILRDTWGVPHIFGVTDADVAFGLAYAHAEDDFLTIQQSLVAARGQLASVYGKDAAPNDYMVHLLRIQEVVALNYDALQPDTRALLEAYATGLNRYAAGHSDEALPGLFPVTGADIVAGSVHKSPLFFGLDGVLAELFADERQRELVGRRVTGSAIPAHSNVFSAGPGRTAAGQTFLAVNSHQPWSGPVAWYEAHLRSEEGWDMTGALFPSSPVIIHGHNRDLGWAFTVNSPDLVDVYVLDINPDNPDQYRVDGRWLELEARPAPITVKLLGRLSWTVREEVLWSIYGPAVRRDHGTYAVRYAGMGQAGIFEQLYRMNKATDLAQFQAALQLSELPMFNVGYADKSGNVYYVYNGLLPVRAEGYAWDQYLPGDSRETLWTDYLPFEQLPQVLNPPAGFIQNANSSPFQTTLGPGNPDPDAYSATLGIETTMSNRALRLLQLLGADESITAESFRRIKYDVGYADESLVTLLIERLAGASFPPDSDPDLEAGIALLTGWDRQADADSRATALAVLTLHYLNEAAAARINPSQLTRGEVPDEALDESFRQAIQLLRDNYGRLDIPWQEVNRLRRGDVDVGLAGGPDLPQAIYGQLGADGRLEAFVGDSYILLVTWDAAGAVSSQSVHQFGSATLDAGSAHYADQAPLFARRELKPVWLDEVDIRAHLERAYHP